MVVLGRQIDSRRMEKYGMKKPIENAGKILNCEQRNILFTVQDNDTITRQEQKRAGNYKGGLGILS